MGDMTTGDIGAAIRGPTSERATTSYVVLLAAMLSFNLMDRQLLAVVAEPIKIEFGLTDTELGLLTGLIFAALYGLASVPIAWLADRWNRVGILTVCGTAWALTTAATGAVTNFVQLAATRAGLAIGEAGCNPCAQSLIAGYVPPERRGRALAIYSMSGPIGFLVVGIVGGGLSDRFGWRVAFLALGAASLICAFLCATILPEPPRAAAAPEPDAKAEGAYRRLIGKPTFQHFLFATAYASIATYGISAWATVFMIRYFQWTPGQVGLVFGSLGTVAGLFGTWFGGRLSDRLMVRDRRAAMWIAAAGCAAVIPFDIAGALAGTITIIYVTSPAGVFCRTIILAPAAATLQRLATDNTRARAAATAGVVGTLLGLGVGPTLVGVLSDVSKTWVAADALRVGLLILVIPQALSAYHFWRAARTVDQDMVE